MGSFYPLHGYWIWFVWAVIAILVVIGYVRVRSRLDRLERSEDPATAEARKRHAAEKAKRKRHGVE